MNKYRISWFAHCDQGLGTRTGTVVEDIDADTLLEALMQFHLVNGNIEPDTDGAAITITGIECVATNMESNL